MAERARCGDERAIAAALEGHLALGWLAYGNKPGKDKFGPPCIETIHKHAKAPDD